MKLLVAIKPAVLVKDAAVRTRVLIASFGFGLFLFVALPNTRAISISIPNFGFEADSLPSDGDEIVATPASWTSTLGTVGVRNPTLIDYGLEVPNPVNVAFVDTSAGAGSLEQTLSDIVTGYFEYTLTARVGDRNTKSFTSYALELYGGPTLLSSTSAPLPLNGAFTLASTTFLVPAGHPGIGQPLRIVLSATAGPAGSNVDFDWVTLDFTNTAAPEPTTVSLLLVGAVILSRRFRRH